MNAQDIISSGILELYCTGLTSAAETAEVKVWAIQYPEVAAEINAIEAGLENYAQAHGVVPDASVKEKLFAAINTKSMAPVVDLHGGSGHVAKIRSISPVWKYAAAASIVLLAGSLIFTYTLFNKYQAANQELASTQSELKQQKDIAKTMDMEMGVMTNRNAVPVALNPMADVPDANARIYWMQNTGDVYIDPSNLPVPEKGKQYQFWAIVDGVPVSGGMIDTNFEIDGKKVRIQKMKSFGKAEAFAVSLEDAGPEKPAPTKVMVLGKI